jgi:tetratricopeptide (TPR) repeat protein
MRHYNKLLLIIALLGVFFISCVDKKQKANNLIIEALMKSDNYDFNGALINYNQAIILDSTNAKIWFMRANIKMSLNMFNEAIIDYNKSIELNEKNMDAYYNLGSAYFIIGNKNKACENYFIAYKMGKSNIEDKIKNCKQINN